jgi:hypothetical protein
VDPAGHGSTATCGRPRPIFAVRAPRSAQLYVTTLLKFRLTYGNHLGRITKRDQFLDLFQRCHGPGLFFVDMQDSPILYKRVAHELVDGNFVGRSGSSGDVFEVN